MTESPDLTAFTASAGDTRLRSYSACQSLLLCTPFSLEIYFSRPFLGFTAKKGLGGSGFTRGAPVAQALDAAGAPALRAVQGSSAMLCIDEPAAS